MGMLWICPIFCVGKDHFRKILKTHNFEFQYTLEKGVRERISQCGFALALQAEVPWQKCGPSWKELKGSLKNGMCQGKADVLACKWWFCAFLMVWRQRQQEAGLSCPGTHGMHTLSCSSTQGANGCLPAGAKLKVVPHHRLPKTRAKNVLL